MIGQHTAPFDPDSQASIRTYQRQVVPPEHLSYALVELYRGHMFYLYGDYYHSDSRFAHACEEMEKLAGNEGAEVAATLLDERAKPYRGQPYERASAFLYRAFCQFNRGRYEGALAAARHALACDQETKAEDQKLREDFGIAYFMAALSYAKLGEVDNAKTALRVARQHYPENPHLAEEVLDRNFVAVLGLGQGPFLVEGAWATKSWSCGPCPVGKVEVYVDGEQAGSSAEVTDLLSQAKSQEWGKADSARVGRTIGKFILSVVLSALAGSNVNIEEKADLRCWYTVPRKYHIVAASLPPGNHTVEMRCFDSQGKPLPRYRQVWFDIPVGRDLDRLAYFRIQRNSQNTHGLVAKKIPRRGTPGKKRTEVAGR